MTSTARELSFDALCAISRLLEDDIVSEDDEHDADLVEAAVERLTDSVQSSRFLQFSLLVPNEQRDEIRRRRNEEEEEEFDEEEE